MDAQRSASFRDGSNGLFCRGHTSLLLTNSRGGSPAAFSMEGNDPGQYVAVCIMRYLVYKLFGAGTIFLFCICTVCSTMGH